MSCIEGGEKLVEVLEGGEGIVYCCEILKVSNSVLVSS
jgi:hypothetical protein